MGERDIQDGQGRAPGRHRDLRPRRGLLSPSRAADIERHLEDCELCADVRESLEEIQGLLGSVPVPSRMPDDVAERIDAALAHDALDLLDEVGLAVATIARRGYRLTSLEPVAASSA